MQELTLSSALTTELAALYQGLQEEYDRVADSIPLTCTDCPDNCCDSWFFHHTYSEWAYLWQGLRQLDAQTLARIIVRAEDYLRQSEEQLAAGQRPKIICPLNEQGRCSLYGHRLLVCRMHGIPATLTRPDGQTLRFPGCCRCQQIVEERYRLPAEAPAMNRTQLFSRMAALELRLTGGNRQLYPKIKKPLAELIVQGPPVVGTPPLEIANQGIEAIRQYFASLQPEDQPLNEVKVLLVGEGEAGKTLAGQATPRLCV